jgi:uncharacterized protein (TIGR00369 family)
VRLRRYLRCVRTLMDYPPARHLLRDLRLHFEHDDGPRSRAWMPVVPEICDDDGAVRAGALAILVDVIGGGLAARVAQPDWIATADLSLHCTAPATRGEVEARGRVLRSGRTTQVLEVTLHCESARVGIATMSFSVLPRRASNPDMEDVNAGTSGPSTMALPESRLDAPLEALAGIEVIDAAQGIVELPVREWAMNSMGALQGGVVGVVVGAAAEAALRAASGEPLVVTDLQLTYLSFGKVGPLRTRTDVLALGDGHGTARVTLTDDGAEARRMTSARVIASKALS